MKQLILTIQKTATEVLIATMITTMNNVKMGILFVAIQEELELRIGENKVDEILDANR